MQKLQFPDGFLWGASTAAYQVEGGIENTDWAQAARDGLVPMCGVACDHYNRFRDDLALAKSLGHTVHRFSVEWARIEPEEGVFNKQEIEHYKEVLRELRALGIKPMITLWHFTLPLWFSERGGFERKDAPEIFARYCAFVVRELGDLCDEYATINEPVVFVSNGYRRGTWPPFQKWPLIDNIKVAYKNPTLLKSSTGLKNIVRYFKVFNQLARSHRAAFAAIKEVNQSAKVSIVKHVILFHANGNPFNILYAKIMNWHWTHHFLNMLKGDFDSIGLNYYLHKKFGDTKTYDKTDMGWDIYPEGIYGALQLLKKYKKPIMVTEAGIANADDSKREAYILHQVQAVHKALEDGIDVRGHCYWSLLDNYEWAEGFEKRFGLIEIHYQTQERKIRPSAYTYKEICEQNGVTIG